MRRMDHKDHPVFPQIFLSIHDNTLSRCMVSETSHKKSHSVSFLLAKIFWVLFWILFFSASFSFLQQILVSCFYKQQLARSQSRHLHQGILVVTCSPPVTALIKRGPPLIIKTALKIHPTLVTHFI